MTQIAGILIASLLMATISSFNGNGLRNKCRRRRALSLCEASIICLQETHWDGESVDEVKKEWRGEVFANNGGERARGVAILINSGDVQNARKVEDDGEGRMIGVQYEYMGDTFKWINVYAPNTKRERRVFFEGLNGKCGGNCLIVGDFNVWCEKLDAPAGARFRSDNDRLVFKYDSVG